MALTSTRTVMSDGGKAAKPKYNDEVLKKIAEELERTHSAARNAAQKPQSPAPAFASVERNKPSAPFGDTDPRTRTAFAQKPQSPTPAFASAERSRPSASFGDTDPRTRTAFAQKPQSPIPAFASTEKSRPSAPFGGTDPRTRTAFAQKPQSPTPAFASVERNKPSAPFGDTDPRTKPEEEDKKPKVFLSDAQKRKYGLWSNMGKIAGGEVYDYFEPLKEWLAESKNREYTPTSREKFLYNRYNDMGKIAGKVPYDYFIKFKNPSMVNYTPSPRERQKQKISDGLFAKYNEEKKKLNVADSGDAFYNLIYGMANQLRGTPANTISKFLKKEYDLIELYSQKLEIDLVPEFKDWLNNIEDNSDILLLSNHQYNNADLAQSKIKNALNKCINKKLEEDVGFLSGTFEVNIDFDVVKNAKDFVNGISSKLEFGAFFPVALYIRTSVNKYEELREKGVPVYEAYVDSNISGAIHALTEIIGEYTKVPTNVAGGINELFQNKFEIIKGRRNSIDWERICKELTYGASIRVAIDTPELFLMLLKKCKKL